jgi:hypothetical protein
MSEKSFQGPLKLDPGQRPRKSRSCCRVTCYVVFAIFICILFWVVPYIGFKFLASVFSPHSRHFTTASVANENPSAYLAPLIDRNQTFDIAVTVWVRGHHEEDRSGGELDGGGVRAGGDGSEDEDLIETPIFSDIVFRGLKLTDKRAKANVSFRLPIVNLYVLSLLLGYSTNIKQGTLIIL